MNTKRTYLNHLRQKLFRMVEPSQCSCQQRILAARSQSQELISARTRLTTAGVKTFNAKKQTQRPKESNFARSFFFFFLQQEAVFTHEGAVSPYLILKIREEKFQSSYLQPVSTAPDHVSKKYVFLSFLLFYFDNTGFHTYKERR